MINNSSFLINEVPNFHAITRKYERAEWWKEQMKRIIEGYWVSGKWIPGTLYYYVNFHKIRLRHPLTRGHMIGLPMFRDVEWITFLMYEEASGFSGFLDDPTHSCFRGLKNHVQNGGMFTDAQFREEYLPNNYTEDSHIYKNLYRHDGKLKTYIEPREYLSREYLTNLGKPLYFNPAKNVIDLEARGGGKSYRASAFIAHNMITDGATDFDLWYKGIKSKQYLTSETIVGASHAKYSGDLLNKTLLAFGNYPDVQEIDGLMYYPIISPTWRGSLFSGDRRIITDRGSILGNITFSDDPLAANGTRPSRAFLEEAAFMHNIIEVLAALEETNRDAPQKNLVIYGLGTGGLTTQGAAIHIQEIYYNPDAYNVVSYEDIYEKRGRIGFFLPSHMTRNKYKKGPNLITDVEAAKKAVNHEIDSIRKLNVPKKLVATIINNPEKPSEIFYTEEGNFFPTHQLKIILSQLESNDKVLDASWKVNFFIDKESNKVLWEFSSVPPIRSFPTAKGINLNGCWEIFRHPIKNNEGGITHGRYIAGTDPVDNDEGMDTEHSLQSTFILDTYTDEIVAEYTGRTELAEDYYEQLRLGLLYYNCKTNYENKNKGLFGYFKNMNCLHALAEPPEILTGKVNYRNPGLNTSYGTTPTAAVNSTALDLLKTYLSSKAFNQQEVDLGEEESGLVLKNMHNIRSVALLKELINYSKKINTDRVSAMGMLMLYRASVYKIRHKQTQDSIKTASEDLVWARKMNSRRGSNHLYSKVSTPKSIRDLDN